MSGRIYFKMPPIRYLLAVLFLCLWYFCIHIKWASASVNMANDGVFSKLYKKYNSVNLVLRIVIGIILGVILAIFAPDFKFIKMIGELFIGALKGIAPILVFVLVISSLAQGQVKKDGKDGRFKVVILLYLVSTFLASCAAVVASFIFPLTLTLSAKSADFSSAPANLSDIVHNLLVNIVSNPITSLSAGNYLGILFWAIVFGFAMKNIAAADTKNFLSDVAKSASDVVCKIINFAPFGIMGLVFGAVSSSGAEIFGEYGKLILLLAFCMLFVYFISNPIIVFIVTRKNPYPLILKCLKESGITAFFTRSSAANIPVNMALCEELGLDKDMYSISIPLGATINMSGAAVTITIMTLAAVHTLGIDVSFATAIILGVLASFAACGASGVAGGSLLLIPLACSLFGISNDIAIQVVGVGFIIGVLQDSFETALNSSSDVIFTAAAEYRKIRKEAS